MKIYLTVIIKSKSQHTEAVKQKLQDMVIRTKQESACLQYDLHQSLDDPQTFVFYEIWESQEGLDLHNKQPYIIDFGKNVPALLESPPVLYKTRLV